MSNTIKIGHLHMRSGERIEFAARLIKWTHGFNEITEIDYEFVRVNPGGVMPRTIPIVNFIAWTEVVGITVTSVFDEKDLDIA